jgi:hypothetical protein
MGRVLLTFVAPFSNFSLRFVSISFESYSRNNKLIPYIRLMIRVQQIQLDSSKKTIFLIDRTHNIMSCTQKPPFQVIITRHMSKKKFQVTRDAVNNAREILSASDCSKVQKCSIFKNTNRATRRSLHHPKLSRESFRGWPERTQTELTFGHRDKHVYVIH